MINKIYFKTQQASDRSHFDVIVIGSGMGSLTAACLLANENLSVLVLEQNYLPGGCTSSYWRKGYVFEAGATTLVGLDENMPLHWLLHKTGIPYHIHTEGNEITSGQLPASLLEVTELSLPMKVYLKNGKEIRRYKDKEAWIKEAERVFGEKNQRKFWEFCFKISDFVWNTSLRQIHFPPTRLSDWIYCASKVSLSQLQYAPYAFFSVEWLIRKFGLENNVAFADFINEQLMITAQNKMNEVNVLFGATSLCYTNLSNYYVPGGLLNLVSPLTGFLESHHGEIHLQEEAQQIQHLNNQYIVKTNNAVYTADYLISGIPLNNISQIYADNNTNHHKNKILDSTQLNSAFQMGIVFRKTKNFDCLHYQIHVTEPLPFSDSLSFFVSLSHPSDNLRCSPDEIVASVSTHIPNPEQNKVFDKEKLENVIFNELEKLNFFSRTDILYYHSSIPTIWEKWTKRKWGFVGGYPQYLHVKPWQMPDARLDGKKAYNCGDTVYPGQGIPGTVLSGIIAFEKLKTDHSFKKDKH